MISTNCSMSDGVRVDAGRASTNSIRCHTYLSVAPTANHAGVG